MAEKNTQPRPMPPLSRKTVESGLILPMAVSETRMPESAVSESINFHFDAIGSATLRPGSTLLGNAIGANINGLHYFVDTVNGTNSQMIAVSGTSTYYLSGGGTWTSIRAGLTSTKARFCTYLNYVFMCNGTEPTAIWDGNTAGNFVSSGNALSAPQGNLIENFRGRIWIAGITSQPSRLYYSSVPSSANPPTITWDNSVQFFDVSPSDGDSMTALARFRTTLVVFKTNHMYRVFDIGQSDPDPYYAVGTYSQESVVETKTGLFFHHSTGFYQYNVYGIVQEISRPIIDIIKAIPSSAYTSVTGWIDPLGDHICWALGPVTVNGVTYTNLEVRYTISTQVWTHYQRPTRTVASLRRQPLYNDGTTLFTLTGDTTGKVYKADTGLTDNGVPIFYSLIHRWDTFDGLLSTRMNIQTVNFCHYGGAGSTVTYQTELQDPNDLQNWTQRVDRGSLDQKNTGFNSANIKGRKVRFRVFGNAVGPFTYNGFEILDVYDEFIQFSQ